MDLKTLLACGLNRIEISMLQQSKCKDKNSFVRGLVGPERYKELQLKDYDFNNLNAQDQDDGLSD